MKLRVRHVAIPMRYAFGHARASRAVADNVVVEVELGDGTRGWGECVPREYVTGETIATVFGALTQRPAFAFDDDSDLSTVSNVLADRALGRDLAANAALELAILDAYARREERPLLDAAALVPAYAEVVVPSPATVRQTLTIGDDLDGALTRAGSLSGAIDVKVKVGFGAERDRDRVAALRARFPEADLRADANAAWDREAARTSLHAIGSLSSIEEPLARRDLEGCAALRATVPVMLDESVCSVADLDRAIDACAADLVNLRLSKCGGLFGTLRLVARASSAGLGWQLGCMVGESGILSCLGRSFAGRIRGARYFESTVPCRSLESDITDAQLDHVSGTRDTPVPTGIGFGANIREDVLARYTIAELVVRD